MDTKKENIYNTEDMAGEYRKGYLDGYIAGFRDGKDVHNGSDSKRDVG